MSACPFCGGKTVSAYTDKNDFDVRIYYGVCASCGGEGPPRRTAEEAIAAFTRPASRLVGWVVCR